MSMQVARDEETTGPVKRSKRAKVPEADDDDVEQPSLYVPANMRPGLLLLPEFSKVGPKDNRRVEKMAGKIVNMAYALMNEEFTHTPWGFFCEPDRLDTVHLLLKAPRKGAKYANDYAIKEG